ncbi:MAG: Bacterial regulatory protein luxR family [Planctomycetota bacterium]|jgi:DNA-binding CsgD family transcriptional regulator/DNA-binding MarR family transcriptional regulator
MPTTVLSLDSPALASVFIDLRSMQLWEILRRSGKCWTPSQVAEAAARQLTEVQQSLDRLVEGGLVTRAKARGRSRHVTYSSVSEQVVVRWDRTKPEQFDALQSLRLQIRKCVFDTIERNINVGLTGTLKRPWLEQQYGLALTREEARAVHAALRAAFTAIDQIAVQSEERRIEAATTGAAKKRLARDSAAGGVPDSQDAEGELTYQIAIDMRPLAEPPQIIPAIGVWEAGGLAHELEYRRKSPLGKLSKRELEVAKRLAAGESRPKVAASLGLTANTVSSITKRIYAKLGVHSRAEFTARMKGG